MSETTQETEPLTLVEQREVAFRAMRDKANVALRHGDLVHLTLLVADVDDGVIVDIPKDWRLSAAGWYEIPFTAADSITRPPLPTAPGSRGDAKVRGKARTTVVRAGNPVGHQQWMSATSVEGESWHADCDITEYVPEGER